MRLWALLLGIASSAVLYRLTRALFPESPAWVAAISVAQLNAALIYQLVTMALVPEMPLLLFALFAAWMLVTSILGNLFNDLRDPAVARLWSALSYVLLALLPVLIAHGLISGYRTLAPSTRQLFALGAWLAWGLFGLGLLVGRPFLGA